MSSVPIVLVTGATGNAGGALVRRLVEEGTCVARAGLRHPGRQEVPAGAEPVGLDYDDPATFAAALDGVEATFVVAPPMDTAADVRVAPFVEAARQAGVRRMVLLSAQGVEQVEAAPLRKLEHVIERSGVPWTVLRPNWFMQNFSHGFALSSIRAQGAFYVPAEDARLAFVDANDIAAVASACLLGKGHEGRAYALTGPEALSHGEVAALMTQAAGREIRYVPISDGAFRRTLGEAGTPAQAIEYISILFAAVRAGHAAHPSDDVRRVTGHPPTPFLDFAVREANAWRP